MAEATAAAMVELVTAMAVTAASRATARASPQGEAATWRARARVADDEHDCSAVDDAIGRERLQPYEDKPLTTAPQRDTTSVRLLVKDCESRGCAHESISRKSALIGVARHMHSLCDLVVRGESTNVDGQQQHQDDARLIGRPDVLRGVVEDVSCSRDATAAEDDAGLFSVSLPPSACRLIQNALLLRRKDSGTRARRPSGETQEIHSRPACPPFLRVNNRVAISGNIE